MVNLVNIIFLLGPDWNAIVLKNCGCIAMAMSAVTVVNIITRSFKTKQKERKCFAAHDEIYFTTRPVVSNIKTQTIKQKAAV